MFHKTVQICVYLSVYVMQIALRWQRYVETCEGNWYSLHKIRKVSSARHFNCLLLANSLRLFLNINLRSVCFLRVGQWIYFFCFIFGKSCVAENDKLYENDYCIYRWAKRIEHFHFLGQNSHVSNVTLSRISGGELVWRFAHIENVSSREVIHKPQNTRHSAILATLLQLILHSVSLYLARKHTH